MWKKIMNSFAFFLLALLEYTFITCATDGLYKGADQKALVILAAVLGIYLLYCIGMFFTKKKMELTPLIICKVLLLPIGIGIWLEKRKKAKKSRKKQEDFWKEFEMWYFLS